MAEVDSEGVVVVDQMHSSVGSENNFGTHFTLIFLSFCDALMLSVW